MVVALGDIFESSRLLIAIVRELPQRQDFQVRVECFTKVAGVGVTDGEIIKDGGLSHFVAEGTEEFQGLIV